MKWGKNWGIGKCTCLPAAGMCSACSFPACQSCNIDNFGAQAPSTPVCGVYLLSLLQLSPGGGLRCPVRDFVAMEGHPRCVKQRMSRSCRCVARGEQQEEEPDRHRKEKAVKSRYYSPPSCVLHSPAHAVTHRSFP